MSSPEVSDDFKASKSYVVLKPGLVKGSDNTFFVLQDWSETIKQ